MRKEIDSKLIGGGNVVNLMLVGKSGGRIEKKKTTKAGTDEGTKESVINSMRTVRKPIRIDKD